MHVTYGKRWHRRQQVQCAVDHVVLLTQPDFWLAFHCSTFSFLMAPDIEFMVERQVPWVGVNILVTVKGSSRLPLDLGARHNANFNRVECTKKHPAYTKYAANLGDLYCCNTDFLFARVLWAERLPLQLDLTSQIRQCFFRTSQPVASQ